MIKNDKNGLAIITLLTKAERKGMRTFLLQEAKRHLDDIREIFKTVEYIDTYGDD